MDPKPVTDPLNDPPPTDPATGQPDHAVEVATLKQWVRQNAVSLLLSVAAVVLVCVYLDPVDVLKVVFGLGLVIFIHELGHFLAAKWCDVHVKTFAIGFPPPIPFCSYKWGETTYMIGIIPLGGYVSMVGEGDSNNDDDEPEEDPRSFRQKSVGQRMLIISAGVVMNIILGMACFVAAYMHGVQEKPATVASVESGSAAWRAGVRTGSDITRINSRERPFFNDLQPIVMATQKGRTVSVDLDRNGQTSTHEIEPLRDEGVPFPQLGIAAPGKLTLIAFKKAKIKPVVPGSPAAAADPPFEGGDRIVAMTDPADPTKVTPLLADPAAAGDRRGFREFQEYQRRMVLLAGRRVTFHVLRKGQPDDASPTAITVAPTFRADTGLRMQMGEVIAVRAGSPADGKIQARPFGGEGPQGDKILTVEVPEADGSRTRFTNQPPTTAADPKVKVRPLDPMRLPFDLDEWAARTPGKRDVTLTVLRLKPGEHSEKPETLTLAYDDGFRFDREAVNNPNSPLPVSGLGLAYQVDRVIDGVDPDSPAAKAGLRAGDQVTDVRFKDVDDKGEVKPRAWVEVKPHQWAAVESAFQRTPPYEMDVKVKRGEDTLEVSLKGEPDKTWPQDDPGLAFQADTRTQKATDFADALGLGAWRTLRFINTVYLNLYALVTQRVSPATISGPLTIATVSYRIAGEDLWQYLVFLAMISVNLAVVNFLPIPVLDGGHMVFLIYEKVTGRPLPDRVFTVLMYMGLAFVLFLLVFSLWQDIKRLFLG